MNIERVGLTETKKFAAGYEAIFGPQEKKATKNQLLARELAALLQKGELSRSTLDGMFAKSDDPQELLDQLPEAARLRFLDYLATTAAEPTNTKDEEEEWTELHRSVVAEEEMIGRAFKNGLLEVLPENLTNFERYLEDVEPISKEQIGFLSEHADARGCLPSLLRCGLRPMSIYYATEGVAHLVDRFRRLGLLDEETPVVLHARASLALKRVAPVKRPERPGMRRATEIEMPRELTPAMLAEEIKLMTECSAPAAKGLLAWLIDVAHYKPFLFTGHETAPAAKYAVALTKTDAAPVDLQERWRVTR